MCDTHTHIPEHTTYMCVCVCLCSVNERMNEQQQQQHFEDGPSQKQMRKHNKVKTYLQLHRREIKLSDASVDSDASVGSDAKASKKSTAVAAALSRDLFCASCCCCLVLLCLLLTAAESQQHQKQQQQQQQWQLLPPLLHLLLAQARKRRSTCDHFVNNFGKLTFLSVSLLLSLLLLLQFAAIISFLLAKTNEK